jgi:hypothetical protein
MDGRLFSPFGVVIWILMLAGIFGVARITPWRPLRIVVNGFGILLVAITLWNLVAQILMSLSVTHSHRLTTSRGHKTGHSSQPVESKRRACRIEFCQT